MDIQFSLPDAPDGSRHLGQLRDWLRRDRDLRTTSEVSVLPAPPDPEAMGAGLEVLQLILDSSLQLASLAVAIVSWRKANGTRPAMTITRGDVEIRLGSADLEDVSTVLEALERLRDADDAAETGDDEGDGDGGR
ncbi:hypothetical protein G4Z16_27125 [Streptomyces bathyalis]|uniref:Uncharacterized protein n=1 Tax=Streptomyces bathyalis TaxID=2710756 RepID=A0A7T1WUR0_9ACTN|nr:hypothetical protein [Streptomyces bathyalis]QPP09477.1 hypothetical protein G4Z16_27125 [Streptomyces bathyalis]